MTIFHVIKHPIHRKTMQAEIDEMPESIRKYFWSEIETFKNADTREEFDSCLDMLIVNIKQKLLEYEDLV